MEILFFRYVAYKLAEMYSLSEYEKKKNQTEKNKHRSLETIRYKPINE